MDVRARLQLLLQGAPADADAIEFDRLWWTWGRLRTVADAVHAALDDAGCGADARVGLVLENRPEHVAALLSVIAHGRSVVTLSPLQPPERLCRDMALSGAPIVLASPDVLALPGVLAAAEQHALVLELGPDGGLRHVGGSVPAGASTNPGVPIEMLTSGTTGPPKRIRLTDGQFNSAVRSSGQAPRSGGLLSQGVAIVNTPLVHIGGMWGVLANLHAGRRIVLLPRFTLDSWVDAVERHRPRAGGLVPAAIRAVLEAEVPPERLASLEVVICGTAPIPVEQAVAFQERYGARVLITYGATEFAGAIAGWTLPLHREWWDRKAGSTGRAYPGVELRVVSPAGDVLPPGAKGQLEARTTQSPQGGHVWQRTSDLAEVDEDGFLWIRGRADDAIIRGGFKVHPDVVVAALERHPAVREAAVAGLPDVRLGQVPVAAVELQAGATPPDEAELRTLCRQHLTPYEVPVRVLVVDELPRTPSMKVSRVDLLALFQDLEPDPGGGARGAA